MKILMWLSAGLDRRTPSEHLLTAIAEALCAQGHSVHILQKQTGGDKPSLPPPMQRCGVTTTCIPFKNPRKSNFVSRYLKDVQYALRCRHFLKTHSFDRVFLQSSNVAGVQAALAKHFQPQAPLTFNVQDIFPENAVYSGRLAPGGIARRLLSAEQRYAYRSARRIITISEDMKQQLEASGADGRKIAVIYNWSYRDGAYDPAQLNTAVVRDLLPQDRFNVVYAGNIGLMQNVELLLRAAELTQNEPRILYHIIGEGLYQERLAASAAQSGLENVRFGKMLPPELAPALYCTADVNVIPLAENIYKTALPSKTATCLACGKPIIFCMGRESLFASRAEQQAACYALSSKDAQALADQILELSRKRTTKTPSAEFLALFSRTQNSRRYAEIITD